MIAEKISRAIGEIDDKYIEEAASFSRSKKQIFMRRICALAACLAIIVSTVFSGNFLYLFSQAPVGFTLIDTHKKSFFDFSFGAEKTSAVPVYWKGALYAKVYSKDGVYKTGENVEICFELGAAREVLGGGDLIIEIDGGDFSAESSYGKVDGGKIIIEDFTSENYSKEEPLCFKITLKPEFKDDWASGRIRIFFGFRFDDFEGFIAKADEYMSKFPSSHPNWREDFFKDNMLELESVGLDYACDGVELWLSPRTDMLLEKMLMIHYDTWRISGKEFMRVYYEYLYRDNIFASVTRYMEEEELFRFEYISKNIRYEKTEFISDGEIWSLMQEIQAMENTYPPPVELEENRMQMAYLLLDYMYKTGVITETEYKEELVWVSEAPFVGNMQAAYPGKMGGYAHKLQKYIYTHKD